jgi:hypothetical protein
MDERGQAGVPTDDLPLRRDGDRIAVHPASTSTILGLAAVIGVLAWPRIQFQLPTSFYTIWGLDFSWVIALHLAALQQLQWGRDILFTYGPLGFLCFPSVAIPQTAAAGLLFVAATTWLLAAALLLSLERWLPLWAACAGSFCGVVLLGAMLPEAVCLAGLLIAGLVLDGALGARGREWATLAVAAGAGLLLLVKTSSGVALLIVVPLLVWVEPAGSLRRGLGATLAFAGTFTAAWLAANQSLAGLPRWLQGALLLVSAYTEAMSLEEPARRWEIAALAIYLVSFALAFAAGCERAHPRRLAASIAMLAAVGWVFVKAGFVRHAGPDHPPLTFGFLLIAALLVPWRRPWRPVGLGLGAIAALLVTLARGVSPLELVDPLARAHELSFALSTVASPGARETRALAAQASTRREVPLPPALVEALRGHRVHVDPHDVALVWAYGLDWAPVPVFQGYAAFAPALDRMNAERLGDPRGPDRILRRRQIRSIDGRSPLWETPEYALARLCRFRPLVDSEFWQVLERGPDRCGPELPLGTSRAKPGVAIPVPEPRAPDRIVVAHLDAPELLAERLVTALFKPRTVLHARIDDQRFRLVRANLVGPLLLRVPKAAAGWPPEAGLSIDSIQIEGASAQLVARFAEIPLAAVP